MRLYRFPYSCYAWKVQVLLELAGAGFQLVEVPFCDRAELLALSGGIQVPVLALPDGRVLSGSRDICEALLGTEPSFARFLPPPLQGPIWAYADWIESEMEDTLFRLAAPGIARRFAAQERAFFTLIKERKYGQGAVEAWAAEAGPLEEELGQLLAPTALTLAQVPFLLGEAPTVADAALYGQLAMLTYGAPECAARLAAPVRAWMQRLQQAGVSRP